ncbi:RNA polymerase Rpc34 [Massarina eburnea CBS 473.64]|uniref:DNA-directed RNA polymerase III subunit RPC6 n=1 Tax=Massarina eburnea CBS 473.64 TaxID=1395130 RepID=A0A6A6S9I1_9PLEO|nr:RNA polymerase Rpc34 [Massarina eburnea CBS 473.64]
MASASTGPKTEDVPMVDATHRIDELYEQCASRDAGTIFFQRDLSGMQVAESVEELLALVNSLCSQQLMKMMVFDNEPCWKVRPRREAEKLRTLTADEGMVYTHIDLAQAEGVWSKALRAKTNFTQAVLTKCLKALESKDLVQSVMSVKHPNRKMYLLKTLKPSEDIAGGLWQSNGDFDMGMIDEISQIIARKIEVDTCIRVPASWNNYAPEDRGAAIAQKKAQVMGVRDIEEAPAVRPYRPPVHAGSARLVHKDKPHYATSSSMAAWLNAAEVLKGRVARDEDMEQLLEMMVLDGRLEKVSAINYRTALNMSDAKVYNGFVDAPCGTCPVFDLCADEGAISARACVYFGEWLGTDSEEIY